MTNKITPFDLDVAAGRTLVLTDENNAADGGGTLTHTRFDAGTLASWLISGTNTWQGVLGHQLSAGNRVLIILWEKNEKNPFVQGYTFPTSTRQISHVPEVSLEPTTGTGKVHFKPLWVNPKCVVYVSDSIVDSTAFNGWPVVIRFDSTDKNGILHSNSPNVYLRAVNYSDFVPQSFLE